MRFNRPYIRLSSPWLLPAAPALAYAVAYLDRLGEAQAHAIPADWIAVSVTDALSRTVGVVAGIVVMIGALLWAEYLGAKETGISHFFGHLIVGVGYGIMVLVLQIGWPMAITAVAVGTVMSWFGLFGVTSPRETADSESIELKRHEGYDLGESKAPAVLFLAVSAAILLLAFWSGYWRADVLRAPLVDTPAQRIVLATYGDRMVMGDIISDSDDRLTVGAVRWLIAVPSEQTSGLVAVHPTDVNWK